MLGLSAGRITQLISSGLPTSPDGRWILLGPAKEWYEQKIRGSARKRGPKSDKVQLPKAGSAKQSAAARLLAAQADRAESLAILSHLEVRRRRNELLEADECEQAWSKIILGARNQFLYVGAKTGPKVAIISDPLECSRIIDAEIRRCLQLLADNPFPQKGNKNEESEIPD